MPYIEERPWKWFTWKQSGRLGLFSLILSLKSSEAPRNYSVPTGWSGIRLLCFTYAQVSTSKDKSQVLSRLATPNTIPTISFSTHSTRDTRPFTFTTRIENIFMYLYWYVGTQGKLICRVTGKTWANIISNPIWSLSNSKKSEESWSMRRKSLTGKSIGRGKELKLG